MTPVLVLVAVLATFGAAVATAARVPRVAVLGLVLALVAAPFVADPAPSALAIASRLAFALPPVFSHASLFMHSTWAAVVLALQSLPCRTAGCGVRHLLPESPAPCCSAGSAPIPNSLLISSARGG